MFESKESFLNWLKAHGVEGVYEMTAGLPPDVISSVQDVYEGTETSVNEVDMLFLSGALGKATPRIVAAVKSREPFKQNAKELRSFAIAHAISLFRLIDRGVSGASGRLAGSGDPMMVGMFPPDQMESGFILPMVEQIVDQVLEVFSGSD